MSSVSPLSVNESRSVIWINGVKFGDDLAAFGVMIGKSECVMTRLENGTFIEWVVYGVEAGSQLVQVNVKGKCEHNI